MGITLLMAWVQILDFLAFHPLFGPWAIIIGELLMDVGKFVVVREAVNKKKTRLFRVLPFFISLEPVLRQG